MRRWFAWIVLVYAFAKAEGSYAQSQIQEKVEREYRIDISQVPQKAQLLVSNFAPQSKVKWLKEEDNESTSIEAKFKTKGRRYSIEFDQGGTLEDIEVIVSFSEIPDRIKKQIKNYLDTRYDYYKVEKVQRQFLPEQLPELPNIASLESVLPHYELVVKTRAKGKKAKRFQFLFDKTGSLISQYRIVLRSDNILRF